MCKSLGSALTSSDPSDGASEFAVFEACEERSSFMAPYIEMETLNIRFVKRTQNESCQKFFMRT